MTRKILLIVFFAFTLTAAFPEVSRQTADSIANILNQKEAVCDKSCPLFESENSSKGLVNTLFIDALALIGTVWLFSNYKKKYIIGIGAAVIIIVTGSLFVGSSSSNQCVEYSNADLNCKIVSQGKTLSVPTVDTLATAGDSSASVSDSTAALSDEFSSFDATTTNMATAAPSETSTKWMTNPDVLDPILAFLLIALISLGIKHPSFVRFRGLFLIAGVAWFGFYRGGCNCMISSFQDLISGIFNWSMVWSHLLWLGLLVVATYLFGRIWCGWLCHLGGVQDFLFRSPKLKIWATEKSQRYLRVTRYTIFALWILQLILMRQNLFCQYDPFKTLFNLIFTDWVSIALLALLLLSSVLIYRPFCRTICPVGVILGWISRLLGARRMAIGSDCINCGLCAKECAMHAVKRCGEKSLIDNENCIACGECATACRKNQIKNHIK